MEYKKQEIKNDEFLDLKKNSLDHIKEDKNKFEKKNENSFEKQKSIDKYFKVESVNNQKLEEELVDNNFNASDNIASQINIRQKQKQKEKQIEKILEHGLESIYLNISKEKQIEFKEEGEKIAKKINGLLSQTKIKVKKIIKLIKDWLSVIPGINRFFLEQEVKIKTDKIMNLQHD